MKKIRNILAMAMVVMMIVGLMPGNVFAEDTRTPISTITATSDTDSIPGYGRTYKRPTFTVTAGDPAYFKSGHWLKKDGEEWIQYGANTFTEGTYRYQVQIRIDGEAGKTHKLNDEGVTVTVDENKWAENSIPSVADTYSYAWAFSKEYEITAPVGIPLNFVKNNSWDIGLNYKGKAIDQFSVATGATGGQKPYTFSKVSGPDWISVTSDGTVSGTPNSVGKNSDLVVRVTDKVSATKDITLTVAETVIAPSDRKKISNIVATSDTDSIPKYGEKVKNPTFTVTAGDPAYFKSGHWLKKDGETWKQYEGKTFTEGTYRYQVQIRIDGEAGTTHVIDSNGITATVDENKWAENSIPSVADTYSYAWAYSKEYEVKDTREKISTITATSNLNDIAQLGHTVQYPTFTITDGSQARFNSGRCFWQKMNGTKWEDYRNAKFEEGAYRYQIEIRVDGENAKTYVLDENGVTVTVDGKAWTCSTPDTDTTYSYVWAKSQVFVVRDSSTPLTSHNVITSVNPVGAGTVTATPNSATLGQTVDLTITPNEGYEKENVTLNGTEISGTSFAMPDAVANVVVNFKKDESKNTELNELSAQTLRSGSGFANLAFNPAFTPENRDYTASVDKTLAMIVFNLTKAVNEQTITDVEGLNDTNISNWHPNLQAGENVFEFTVTSKDKSTTGTYKLTVTRGDINEAHNITVVGGTSPISKAFEGDFVSVKANDAPTGMVFDKWTSVPSVNINDANASSTQFEMPNSNVTITANYKPDPETTAYLKDIKVDTKAATSVWEPQTLTFKPETLSYTVDVNEDQEKLDLALHLIDKEQKVEVKKGSKTMTLDIISSNPTSEYLMDDLANGSNVYTINVTAKSGGKTAKYTVTINRGASTVLKLGKLAALKRQLVIA